MEKAFDDFSFADTVHKVQEAAVNVFCRIIFDWAAHGLAVAAVLFVSGLILLQSKHRLARPFLAVSRKLGIFCAIVAIPGVITLVSTGTLPPVGVYNGGSLAFLALWSLICAHMLGEETNYQFTVKKEAAAQASEEKTAEEKTSEAKTSEEELAV